MNPYMPMEALERGALTMEFGDRIKAKKRESTETRIPLRITICCLKIIVRWIYE